MTTETPHFSDEGTEVFLFINPPSRTGKASVLRGVASLTLPEASSDQKVIVKVPNGNAAPLPPYDMFIEPRADVFTRSEVMGSLSSEQQERAAEVFDDPKALFGALTAAVRARHSVVPAA